MYNVNDTIIALSSGETASVKKIIRISGDKTFDGLKSIAGVDFEKQKKITSLTLNIDSFEIECLVYSFCSPNSYTGEDIAEIHICGCDEISERLFAKLLSLGCRAAMAGEFTYRAFANGKMDLSKAEAVAEIIESSNEYQLTAAQKLFGGSIEQKVNQSKKQILELLSLIEAGLDFSAEDIEIISRQKAIDSTKEILSNLEELLSGSITFEQIAQAPAVVIAGAANAGKSSLVNSLVGENRSIISDQSGTTRDVLEHWLKLKNCDCILFDCAGLVIEPADILQTLANAAAMNAVKNSTLIIFCTDITKKDYAADLQVLKKIKKIPAIHIATKCDLLTNNEIEEKLSKIMTLFGNVFLATSAFKNFGLEKLKELIEQSIIRQTSNSPEAAEKTALTERHRQAVNEAIKNIENAAAEIEKGNEEIAAFVLRAAIQSLSKLETEHIDEAILDMIFSRFCIGK